MTPTTPATCAHQHGVRHLICRAEALQRDPRRQLVLQHSRTHHACINPHLAQRPRHVGVYEARRHAVHSDALRRWGGVGGARASVAACLGCHFNGQRACEHVQPWHV